MVHRAKLVRWSTQLFHAHDEMAASTNDARGRRRNGKGFTLQEAVKIITSERSDVEEGEEESGECSGEEGSEYDSDREFVPYVRVFIEKHCTETVHFYPI